LKKCLSHNFYASKEWRRLRVWALSKYGYICMSCGSTKDIQVDHIKPRSLYPRLKLKKWNLQILCGSCNKKKSNVYIDDIRPKRTKLKWFIFMWIKRLLSLSLLMICSLALFYASPEAYSQSYAALLSTVQALSSSLMDYLYYPF
jgi:hypothetical protein